MSEYVTLPQRMIQGYRILGKLKNGNNTGIERDVFHQFIYKLQVGVAFEEALKETKEEYANLKIETEVEEKEQLVHIIRIG